MPSSHIHEPISEMTRKAALDKTAQAAWLAWIPEDSRNIGKRRTHYATGGKGASTQIDATAAHEGLVGASTPYLTAREGITHVGDDSKQRGESPSEGFL